MIMRRCALRHHPGNRDLTKWAWLLLAARRRNSLLSMIENVIAKLRDLFEQGTFRRGLLSPVDRSHRAGVFDNRFKLMGTGAQALMIKETNFIVTATLQR